MNDSLSYQTISGFGAAFTDSSDYLMNQLKGFNPSSYSTLMNQLFSTSSGVGLSFWRLPMTSTDFNSTNTTWTDDDTQGPSGDPDEFFGLRPTTTTSSSRRSRTRWPSTPASRSWPARGAPRPG